MFNYSLNLLDCTLRDGGYINDWRFGKLTIRTVVTRLDRAGIDIIECGFLDSRAEYDEDRSVYPDIPSVAMTLACALPKRAMLVAMIDFGTFAQNLLIPQSDSSLDGIRLIFKKENVDDALAYAGHIKELGYKLFLNPVALTSYRDTELLALLDKINELEPFGMSIVDTYGLMFDETVARYIELMDEKLKTSIALGYHSHNNLDMSNAHCVSYINKKLHRSIVVDSSVLGMGKNAGNACTELLASYVNKIGKKSLLLNQIFECAYTDILEFKEQSNWGYNLDFLISAIHDCSPNWIKFLMNKNTLSIESIRTILSSLPYEKREVSYFHNERAEQIYLEYIDKFEDDTCSRRSLEAKLGKYEILMIYPGETLKTDKAEIEQYIVEHNPIIITVNFITDILVSNFVFINNAKSYSQAIGISSELKVLPKILLTSNILQSDALGAEAVFCYETLYDNSLGAGDLDMLTALLKSIGVTKIAAAGLDGFHQIVMKQDR